MRPRWMKLRNLAVLSTVLSACAATAPEPASPSYIFAWPFIDTSEMAPRGGTTRGAAVKTSEGPSRQWEVLQSSGASSQERDRAAILAMAGEYRTSFDFLETVVFAEPHLPAAPYRSWGTEKVYVVEDRGDFISLQHILEMVFVDDEGNRQGPFVQKHWRQDWQYEPESVHEYVGRREWRRRDLTESERAGRWSQAVYQVDDSPRYAGLGSWEHEPSYSAWESDRTARPLPRRESTVRQDYDILDAINRHTIIPTGWVHEEDNLKVVLPDSSQSSQKVRSREKGVNRYELIEGFDFSGSDAYWEETGPLWKEVRRAWAQKFASTPEVQVATKCGDQPVFVALFGYAEKLRSKNPPEEEEIQAYVAELIECITTT